MLADSLVMGPREGFLPGRGMGWFPVATRPTGMAKRERMRGGGSFPEVRIIRVFPASSVSLSHSLFASPPRLERRYIPEGHANSTRNVLGYTLKTFATMGGILCGTLPNSKDRPWHGQRILGT